jgi:hypothetical protein
MFYLCYLYYLHIYWCSTRFPYHRMFVSLKSNTTAYSHGGTWVPPSPGFSGVRIAQSVVFCIVFYRSLFVLLYFFLSLYVCHSSMFGFVFHYPFSIFTLFYHSILTTLFLCEIIWSCRSVFDMRVKCWPSHSWLFIGFVAILTRRVPLV